MMQWARCDRALQACPAHWVNSWQAYRFHKETLQLSKAKIRWVTIPATLVSNHPEQVIEFAQSQSSLFLSQYIGRHTQLVTKSHLDPKRLSLALSLAFVSIGVYWNKHIRSYVIAGSVYSAEIGASQWSWRLDLQAELIPVELSKSVQQQCISDYQGIDAVVDSYWLAFKTNRWIRVPKGKSQSYVCCTPEHQTGLTITPQLVRSLMKWAQESAAISRTKCCVLQWLRWLNSLVTPAQ